MDVVKLAAPRVSTCKIPTDRRESDGTLEWDTTMRVFAEID